jgi:hypothetical protein
MRVFFSEVLKQIDVQKYISKNSRLNFNPRVSANPALNNRPQYYAVNSMSFIWNDNMREKREANANAT